MANTTIDQLASLTGTAVATNDLFLVYDASANIEKQISSAEMKNMIGNGPLTITTSSAADALVVTSTDAGADGAPDIVFYRNSASPAANDYIGNIVFRGKNSTAVDKEYGAIYTAISSPTNAAESSIMAFHTMTAGTSAERMRINSLGNVGIGIVSPVTPLHVVGAATITSQISGGYALLTAGTVAMALATNRVVKVTPNATATYTTTVAPAGARATVIILTSGATSYTITFGTGFKTTGTLATGVTTARTFVIEFVSDGTSMIEVSRTVAMV